MTGSAPVFSGWPPPPPFGPGSPTWQVSVDWGLTLDDDTQQLYQQMADLLTTVTDIPADRLNYYSAVNNAEWVIGGWNGMVDNVQPAAGGGYLITVSAVPYFPDRTQVAIYSEYTEQYLINQGTMTYVGFQDPNHLAGTMPPWCIR